MTRRITKVKYSDRVIINYEVPRGDSVDTYTLDCTDAPTQAFVDALQALKKLIPAWGDMLAVQADSCEIRGAFFSWKRDIFGGGFTALRPLKNCASPMVLNMPHKPSQSYSGDGDEGMCLTGIENELLLAVCAQAEKYLDGERAQMELPLQSGIEVTLSSAGKSVTLNAGEARKNIDSMIAKMKDKE